MGRVVAVADQPRAVDRCRRTDAIGHRLGEGDGQAAAHAEPDGADLAVAGRLVGRGERRAAPSRRPGSRSGSPSPSAPGGRACPRRSPRTPGTARRGSTGTAASRSSRPSPGATPCRAAPDGCSGRPSGTARPGTGRRARDGLMNVVISPSGVVMSTCRSIMRHRRPVACALAGRRTHHRPYVTEGARLDGGADRHHVSTVLGATTPLACLRADGCAVPLRWSQFRTASTSTTARPSRSTSQEPSSPTACCSPSPSRRSRSWWHRPTSDRGSRRSTRSVRRWRRSSAPTTAMPSTPPAPATGCSGATAELVSHAGHVPAILADADGLIERRHRPIDDGLELLRLAVPAGTNVAACCSSGGIRPGPGARSASPGTSTRSCDRHPWPAAWPPGPGARPRGS